MLILILKGFAMGLADIVPGVSGGTVAFITGIYDKLIESISSVNSTFIKLTFSFQIRKALEHINYKFLAPLLFGIAVAIISMSRVMHFLMNNYAVQTWALFFGLVLASIIYIGKQIDHLIEPKNIISVILGIVVGVSVVSLIPVETPSTPLYLFFSGSIAICAMILPGISGSFLLLILGKYAFITGALKSPFVGDNLASIAIFSIGCLVGILSFSKLLNYLLKHYRNTMMACLTGFMIGSLKKIWPWKEVLESKVIRGKTYVLDEANIIPNQLNLEVVIAISLIIIGFILVFAIERLSQKD